MAGAVQPSRQFFAHEEFKQGREVDFSSDDLERDETSPEFAGPQNFLGVTAGNAQASRLAKVASQDVKKEAKEGQNGLNKVQPPLRKNVSASVKQLGLKERF